MSSDTFFRDKRLRLSTIGPAISESEISSVISDYFGGKTSFVNFYLRHNGGFLERGAYLYRDNFYSVAPGDHNSMAVESFFFIPRHPAEKAQALQSIVRVKELVGLHYGGYGEIRKFIQTHIPFARDPSGNDYWIEVPSGGVRFIMWESFQEGPVEIAPSFYDFVSNLVSERRKATA